MNAESFLSSIVEIGIGIAGFAGIIAAIRSQRLTSWPTLQRLQLQILFFASAAAILFALLPAFLAETGLTDATLWRVASVGMILWLVLAIGFRYRQANRAGVTMPIPRPMIVLASVSLVLQIGNVAVLASAWPYLFGITLLIANGFSMFLLLLLSPQED